MQSRNVVILFHRYSTLFNGTTVTVLTGNCLQLKNSGVTIAANIGVFNMQLNELQPGVADTQSQVYGCHSTYAQPVFNSPKR